MMTTRFYMCALPGELWERDGSWKGHSIAIRSFVEDALAIERRIAKGVNQDNDRRRYDLCCARIEAEASSCSMDPVTEAEQFEGALASGRFPASELEASYLDVLHEIARRAPVEAREIRLAATFFPPSTVATHRSGFLGLAERLELAEHRDVRRRAGFLQLAQEFGCGVVELQNAFKFVDVNEPARSGTVLKRSDVYQTRVTEEDAADNSGRSYYEILRDEIRGAIQDQRDGGRGIVNFSNWFHNIITEVLHEFVYVDSGASDEPVCVQVVYTDGSQGEPFPLCCLPRREPSDLVDLRRSRLLRVALMSMRHLDMDHDVDMAWFRNREVSRSRTLAETDKFCYLQSRNQFREARSDGVLRMNVYHTGFQPAVVGFYRALVEELMERVSSPPSLEVVPYYFRRETGYSPGKVWH